MDPYSLQLSSEVAGSDPTTAPAEASRPKSASGSSIGSRNDPERAAEAKRAAEILLSSVVHTRSRHSAYRLTGQRLRLDLESQETRRRQLNTSNASNSSIKPKWISKQLRQRFGFGIRSVRSEPTMTTDMGLNTAHAVGPDAAADGAADGESMVMDAPSWLQEDRDGQVGKGKGKSPLRFLGFQSFRPQPKDSSGPKELSGTEQQDELQELLGVPKEPAKQTFEDSGSSLMLHARPDKATKIYPNFPNPVFIERGVSTASLKLNATADDNQNSMARVFKRMIPTISGGTEKARRLTTENGESIIDETYVPPGAVAPESMTISRASGDHRSRRGPENAITSERSPPSSNIGTIGRKGMHQSNDKGSIEAGTAHEHQFPYSSSPKPASEASSGHAKGEMSIEASEPLISAKEKGRDGRRASTGVLGFPAKFFKPTRKAKAKVELVGETQASGDAKDSQATRLPGSNATPILTSHRGSLARERSGSLAPGQVPRKENQLQVLMPNVRGPGQSPQPLSGPDQRLGASLPVLQSTPEGPQSRKVSDPGHPVAVRRASAILQGLFGLRRDKSDPHARCDHKDQSAKPSPITEHPPQPSLLHPLPNRRASHFAKRMEERSGSTPGAGDKDAASRSSSN